MKERCRDGCRTSLLIAGVVLVPAIFHTSLPPCHPYITIHFMEMIFSTCDFRYRTCVPFSLSPTLNHSTLCEGVYQKGKDYVYISKQETADFYTNLLNVIGETEHLRKNFAHFESPTSVCEAACELQSEKCQSFLNNFQQTLERFIGGQLNCSKSILDPLPHSCSNLRLCKL